MGTLTVKTLETAVRKLRDSIHGYSDEAVYDITQQEAHALIEAGELTLRLLQTLNTFENK